MKKYSIVFFLFFTTSLFAGRVQTLSITTQELATQYGWSDLQCPRHFDLNDAISVDVDSAGTMKYTMNTKQMHCYQWLGGFTITAQAGCSIKKVKLTYFSHNSGVMTMNWGSDGKNIPEADRIASNQTVTVEGSSVKFYVGTTGTNTDGQIRIGTWEVEYTQPNSPDVMTRTTMDLGKQYGWADGYCPVNIPFNNAISFHSDKTDNVKFYSTTKSFHCYQWSGGFYFKARTGTLIKSVTLIYDPLNNAVLTQNWGTDGRNIPEDEWIASGATVPVNGDSVHFYTGDKSNTNNCQLHITGFSVIYIDSLAHTETWEQCTLTSSDQSIAVVGDNGYYDWLLSKFQRGNTDTLYVHQGTRLLYGGAMATDGEQEGGVKDVSFDWRIVAGNSNNVRFNVTAGDVTKSIVRTTPGNYIMNYTHDMAVKRNCAFAVSLGNQDMPAQPNVIIGPVTITPYLLFKVANHVDSIDTNRSSYDLMAKLINNTDEMPEFAIMENTTGDEVEIKNGVVDLSAIERAGVIKIQASCFGGDVYTTLTLIVSIAPRVRFEKANMTVHLGDAPFVNLLIVPDSVGAITYSSSNTQVAMVNDSGLVTIMGIGQAVITAHVAASELYIATKTSYNLSVVYSPEEGTYRIETFSQCRKKKITEGFAYVEGDDAVYDWNLSYFSRDKQDSIAGDQGILLNYGGSIASNGVQEGGVKYLSFNWRATDPVLPVHFFVNIANTSVSHGQQAVGDTEMVQTYGNMFNLKSNTSFSILVRTKENPAQSQIVVGPLQIVPYLLFTNKKVELELPQTTFDCALGGKLIDNRDDETPITYSIVSAPAGIISIEDGVLDLSGMDEAGDVVVKAEWGEVSTTMTVHLTLPTGLFNVNANENVNCKVMKDGLLLIYRNGRIYNAQGTRL